jgi:hypothetical protein
LCAVFAAAALAGYAEIHLVLSLRRFDEMVVSSIKDVVRSPRPIPPLDLFSRALSDMGARCRTLMKRISGIEFVNKVHVLDYELLRRSPQAYFAAFSDLAGKEFVASQRQIRMVNASPSDKITLDRLVERGVLAGTTRAGFDDIPALIGRDFLRALAGDYAALRDDLLAVTSAGGKVRYYC